MHSWFSKKIGEMTELAQYCHFPVLQAHFVLTQKAVDELYGKTTEQTDSLETILPMLISDAKDKGQLEVLKHLERAAIAIAETPNSSENIVRLDFSDAERRTSQSGYL
ncbi:MAG: hypothetical protein ACRBBO_07065 [Cognatishimia sp.]|uniref:hypothetical protein n=1 Tax=Cognatishimia sp. 1_MG-2023 TaxID=3062642 RepID=UPI0026E3A2E0|nr:hypothetical protein [Cognatishimia sp. 1_MG-2023]MDO6726009.1 hypothetical protein [Cognatishimia sp. 1_MG-2023]